MRYKSSVNKYNGQNFNNSPKLIVYGKALALIPKFLNPYIYLKFKLILRKDLKI